MCVCMQHRIHIIHFDVEPLPYTTPSYRHGWVFRFYIFGSFDTQHTHTQAKASI